MTRVLLLEAVGDPGEGSACNEACRDEGSTVIARFLHRLVRRPAADVFGDQGTEEDRRVELDRQGHAEGEGESRHALRNVSGWGRPWVETLTAAS